MSKILTEEDFINAAAQLGCEVEAIKAVSEVEAPGGGFLPSGKPVILFEAHIFSKLTNGKYNLSHPNISSSQWNRSLYLGGEKEYDRLNIAIKLNEEAALKSASWGKFQILGINFSYCGYKDVKSFVSDMYISEKFHLMAFINFIKSKKIDVYIKNKDWENFALRYNGPAYSKNKYHIKLKLAYEKYKKEKIVNFNSKLNSNL